MNMCNASYLWPLVADHSQVIPGVYQALPLAGEYAASLYYDPVKNFSHFYDGYSCPSQCGFHKWL